MLVDCC